MVAILQFPQVWDVCRNGTTVSRLSLAVHSINGVLWLAYGSLLNEYPILMANSVYLSSTMVLVYCSLCRSATRPQSVSTQTEMHF